MQPSTRSGGGCTCRRKPAHPRHHNRVLQSAPGAADSIAARFANASLTRRPRPSRIGAEMSDIVLSTSNMRLGHGVNDQLLRRAARESTEAGRSGCVCAGGGSNAFLGARERRHGDFANDHVQNHLGLVGGIVGESEGSGPEGGRGELGVSARCAARGAGQDHKHLALRGAEDDLALRRYCWVVP